MNKICLKFRDWFLARQRGIALVFVVGIVAFIPSMLTCVTYCDSYVSKHKPCSLQVSSYNVVSRQATITWNDRFKYKHKLKAELYQEGIEDALYCEIIEDSNTNFFVTPTLSKGKTYCFRIRTINFMTADGRPYYSYIIFNAEPEQNLTAKENNIDD